MKKVRTLFIGTSEFAVPILQACLETDFLDVVAVVTQPDRPTGRKQILTPPPVKQFIQGSIEKGDIEIVQPEKIKKESGQILSTFDSELIIVASYGQIIPRVMLDYPKFKCVNFHGSLLPKLRGAVPIQKAILEGFEKTGVTLQVMSEKMDAGAIISTREHTLTGSETSDELTKTLADLSVEIVKHDLPLWIDGSLQTKEQSEAEATYCYKSDIEKQHAEIRFNTDVGRAERMVRAFTPWPNAWITIPSGKYQGKRLKIYVSSILNNKSEQIDTEKLQIVDVDGQLATILHDGTLLLEEVQLEGKDRRSGREYLWLAE